MELFKICNNIWNEEKVNPTTKKIAKSEGLGKDNDFYNNHEGKISFCLEYYIRYSCSSVY